MTFAFASVVHAGAPSPPVLTATCSFEPPSLTTDSNGATRVSVPGCIPWPRAGLPVLPFRTLRLALPSGFTATGIVAKAGASTITWPGTWQIETASEPVSGPTSAAIRTAVAEEAPSPLLAELASVQRMAGFSIAIVRVFPLRYAPASRRLVFTPDVSIELVGQPVAAGQIAPSARSDEQRRVKSAVDNPEALAETPPKAEGADSLHYLLVTRAALLPAFQPLVALKQAAGITVHTETMESVTNVYPGVDAAERLRACIRSAYTNWRVQHVLLGGDTKVVPYRGVYARCSGIVLNLMPSDLYFACLDGSWNHDGDGIWGEPTDGESGGDVDLLPEVCVGRAPVETAAEVTNFVARCLAAEQASSARFHALLAGESLGDAGAQGGNALDALLPALNDSLCPVAWLDDRPQLTAAWSSADALGALNRGPRLAAHFGHGTDDGYDTTALRLTAQDLASLTNAAPFLLYSTACYTGAFDNHFGMSDCIAEALVKLDAGGAFAVVANTREGWYDTADEGRYSGEFQKAFFARLLSSERTPAGVAQQLATQDLLGCVETSGSNMPYRWCLFGLTLFGDPQASVRIPLSLLFRLEPSERIVTWNSWANRTYAVYRTPDLATVPSTCLASNLAATPPQNVYTDAAPRLVRAFYRVVAQ